ncbi:MAG TPA: hypothetical protein H9824_03415 [Candidatus Bacteroides pullicola]|uniref:Uncharacterized protein n=1 Tax=Candidatus Bacteroides pullicola TaxID=2838475 RepID=A0A9D1ZHP5_9BACE|nr:hypothetical protein [Candidatus Bacteroides pullicola]
MQEKYNTFFGIGKGEAFYDKRRHLNIIFLVCANYQLFATPVAVNELRHYVLNETTEVSASYIRNNILTVGEYNYLNMLRERYNIPINDFTTILSGIGLFSLNFKSPSKYSPKEEARLIIQMMIARNYMQPQKMEAFKIINTMIYNLGQNINLFKSLSTFHQYEKLLYEASSHYPHEKYMVEIEEYVLQRVNI